MSMKYELVCSGCGEHIPDRAKFICVWNAPDGFVIAIGCGHYWPIGNPPPNFVFGGTVCWHRWLFGFELLMRKCSHTVN